MSSHFRFKPSLVLNLSFPPNLQNVKSSWILTSPLPPSGNQERNPAVLRPGDARDDVDGQLGLPLALFSSPLPRRRGTWI